MSNTKFAASPKPTFPSPIFYISVNGIHSQKHHLFWLSTFSLLPKPINSIFYESPSFLKKKKKERKLFNYLCILAVLGLHCCAQAFISCREQGLLSSFGARASHPSGLLGCGVESLGHPGFRAHELVAHELCCSAACQIFPDQGLNLCPLHCKADS